MPITMDLNNLMDNVIHVPSEKVDRKQSPRPQLQPARPAETRPVAASADRTLNQIQILHSSTDVIERATKGVADEEGLLVHFSTSLLNPDWKRDLLVVDCTMEQWERIRTNLPTAIPGAEITFWSFGAASPVTVIANVNDHQMITLEATRCLADLTCDILLSTTNLLPVAGTGGLSCVFNGIVACPPVIPGQRIYSGLAKIVRPLGGRILVADGCFQAIDSWEARQSLVSPVFRNPQRRSDKLPVVTRPGTDQFVLTRVILQMDESEPGVLAGVLQILRARRADVFFPQGMVQRRGAGLVDILCEVPLSELSTVEGALAVNYPEMDRKVTVLDSDRLAGVMISAEDHTGMTLDVARLLSHYGLEIVQSSGAHFLLSASAGIAEPRVGYVIDAIVRFPETDSLHGLEQGLQSLAHHRRGMSLVDGDYRQLFSPNVGTHARAFG